MMNLLEHEAKKILANAGVPVPHGAIVSNTTPELPVVLKLQVPTGGRGKAGGIRVAKSPDEFNTIAKELRDLEIKGFRSDTILAEELLAIEREFYLALRVNREKKSIELLAHAQGGVEIESHEAGGFFRQSLTQDNLEATSQTVADLFELSDQAFVFGDMLERLFTCFTQEDATLLEVNPLVLTTDGKLLAADCKLELDDMAAFRHPQWEFSEKIADANFVLLDQSGTVATIANGAGLAMATVDAVKASGHTPANFLDIGGNATAESIAASFQKIIELPNISSIVINIFGGIVRCDTVAQAILEARQQISDLPRLAIRLSGTNADEARALLKSHDIELHNSLEHALEVL